jgi:hypothetical protein
MWTVRRLEPQQQLTVVTDTVDNPVSVGHEQTLI